MKAQAIIPCAGVGTRLKTEKAKPFVDLGGQPLFMYATNIESIILVVHEEEKETFEKLIASYGFSKPIKIVIGGDTRRDSVGNGLRKADQDTQCIVVHDAARPLITPKLIDETVNECKEKLAVIVAVEASSTIKTVENGVVKETLKRSELWEVQTPQAFDREILEKAHGLPKDDEATDDAMLVEKAGYTVHILQGDYKNIKVTTNEDLIVAQAFLDERGCSAN